VVLLLLAVLVPAAGLLWFMGAAMRNERLAARQKLADAYRGHLSASQARLHQHWKEAVAALEKLAATTSAPVTFAECALSGLVSGVVLFDESGRIAYPNAPSPVNDGFGELESKWQEAGRLEQLLTLTEAAKQYDALAREATNANVAARAFQAEARCLVQAARHDASVQLVKDAFGGERFRRAMDAQGRLIAANTELMALELITNRNSELFQSIAHRLAARLTDYENPALAAPQRRFLMKELQELSPERIDFPTLAAEQLAAEVSENNLQAARSSVLQRSALPNLWQFATPNERVLAFFRLDKLQATTKAALAPDHSLADVKVTLAPPELDTPDALVTLPAGDRMPGWRLALSLADQEFFNATTGRQTAVYLWTALLVVAGMGVLAVVAAHLVRRQMTLARLKNDLVATVSHELKTPLSSMRVLVETLLDSEILDEQKTRDYLELIAQENERLGRLIQNFLTFSRLERRKHQFHYSLLPARQVVDAAVQSVRGRFDAPGCRLDVQIEDDLPSVMADADALATALINLLENAYKYSEEIKHIVLQVRTEKGSVIFSVKDNGIGIAPRERRRIFQPFHQIDQRLSRKGSGCGLGLSIVQFIASAHHGSVSVESQPGRGSTFTISLPASPSAESLGKEAIA
jgi:signal transduction histidine kinase